MQYPEPPQFGSMDLSSKSYASYLRQPSVESATTMGYNNSPTFAEAHYMYSSKSSPGMYAGDNDMCTPSSNVSIGSTASGATFSAMNSVLTNDSGDESKERHRCLHPDCGKVFKDLKAHVLTHQTERLEKCPIVTCEYHIKGFARK